MTNTNATAGRPQTMALQGLTNRIVRGLLATPVLSGVVGRKTGRRYSVPVAYTRHEGAMLVGTPFAWARNLRTGEPVEILLKGKKTQADVQVFTSEPDVTAAYAVICRDNRNFAKFNKVRVGADGEPDEGDLHAAWAAGARAVKLTPR